VSINVKNEDVMGLWHSRMTVSINTTFDSLAPIIHKHHNSTS